MKPTYVIPTEHGRSAVLDVDCYGHAGQHWITRVSVPREHRGTGLGSALLKRALADADREGVTLWLVLAPPFRGAQARKNKTLGLRALRAWYLRHGFKPIRLRRGKGWRETVYYRPPSSP